MSAIKSTLHLPSLFPGARARRGSSDARAEEIAVICHELRNSLAVVRGAVRLLRTSAANGGVDKAHSLIERYADQMSRHIDDLLRPIPRNDPRGLRFSDRDLRVIGRDAADAISAEMSRRGHRLAVALPEEPLWGHVDGVRLEQALSNLLINAAKYTPDGGDITLTMERDGDCVRIRVRDSGIGIEPAMLARIFGLFVQAAGKAPSAENGSGIGLAVVQEIVEAHGGAVIARSPGLGLGSEFTVTLPLQRI
jgi:two-component system CheB/CheR fusion protein